MTFLSMSPWLAWLLIAGAVAGAAALFLIQPRPPQRVISSLIVWRRVLDERPRRSWWDRVRWIVSLVLTLVIAAAIAAALTRPVPGHAGGVPPRVLLVLDSSWSMQARTAAGETRWARAIRAARSVAAAAAGEVALATTADGVVEGPTSDEALIDGAFARLRPNGGADGAWPQIAGATAIHFFTDGAAARIIPADVRVYSVFDPVPNVAITAFELRSAGQANTPTSVFVAVANYAAAPQAVRLTVGRAAAVLLDRTIEIRGGGIHQEALTVESAGEPRFRAHVSAAQNHLDIDDDATAWLWTAEPLRVAVVGRSSLLPRLLAHDASFQVTSLDPERYADARADVLVFDGWVPASAPAKPILAIDPPVSSWLGTRGPAEADPIWAPGGTHPLLGGVDPAVVHVGSARAVIRPTLQPVAVSTQGTPLVAVEDSREGRRIVFGFAVADSNLAVTSAFPILIGNALDWLGRPQRDLYRQPGPVLLPLATRRILAPDGRGVPFTTLDEHVRATFDAPGLYLVQSTDGQSVVRVTLGDMRRSNLLASSLPDASPAIPTAVRARPWWIAAAMAAFVLATVEWITWQRRITV